MKRPHRNDRNAFTLIELVASAVLTVMMMAGLLGIVWSTVRESNELRQSAISRFPVTHLAEQLRIDFHNAQGMSIDSGGVTLHGFLGRDPETLQPMLVPDSVRYEVRRAAGRSVLTRISNLTGTDPVWFGFGSLRVQPLAESDPEGDLLPAAESGGLPEAPLSFRVVMQADDGQILWREVIHHHDD